MKQLAIKQFKNIEEARKEALRIEQDYDIQVHFEKWKLAECYVIYLAQNICDQFKKRSYLRENNIFVR